MNNPRRRSIILILAITAALTGLIVIKSSWHVLLCYIIAINSTTFIIYFYDKIASSREYFRIPEQTLHILALLGGSPAALIAQKFLKHKTSKTNFLLIYMMIVLCQVGLAAYLISRDIKNIG